MILHFSHIGLTDGRTFMIPFGSVTRDAALAAVLAAATGRGRAHRQRAQCAGTFYDSKGPKGAGGRRRPRYEGLVSRASRGELLHCHRPRPSPLVDRNRSGWLQFVSPERCAT